MEVQHLSNKCSYLDTLERVYIFGEAKKKNQINDQHR
jgi:hypothetical protein